MDSINKINFKENILNNIKNKYVLRQIFDNLKQNKSLKIIKYSKLMQQKLGIGIIDFKNYYELIEIELIPTIKKKKNNFINFLPKSKSYYHIYFNDDNSKEIKRNYFTKNDNVKKIKIIIDKEINSFEKLFEYCSCIKKINFIKFNRKDINNMKSMFSGCTSLINLNFSNFNTDNVTNMSWMFSGCSYLHSLNLSNFNTDKVIDMNWMFANCSLLEELNLNNFNTINVLDMNSMFFRCFSLEKLFINNFNTKNVSNMKSMFEECSSLKELNINNFDTSNVINMNCMFLKCLSIKELNIINFKLIKVKDMSEMFEQCLSLEELNLNDFYFNKNNIKMDYMFSGLSREFKNNIKNKFKYFYNKYEAFLDNY